jgi:hypothetical protein
MFVEVSIQGRTLKQVFPIPRHALREGRTIWMAREGRLRIEPIPPIARLDREIAYLAGGVKSGDQVIVSPLDTVTDGMRIRTAGDRTGDPSRENAETDSRK